MKAINLWTVTWQRDGDPELLTCHRLSPEVFLFRLRNAIKNYGSITVHEVKHEIHHRDSDPRCEACWETLN